MGAYMVLGVMTVSESGQADLGQGHEEGPNAGAEVAGRRQVAVHLPALPKLLHPVVKLARHHDLRSRHRTLPGHTSTP